MEAHNLEIFGQALVSHNFHLRQLPFLMEDSAIVIVLQLQR